MFLLHISSFARFLLPPLFFLASLLGLPFCYLFAVSPPFYVPNIFFYILQATHAKGSIVFLLPRELSLCHHIHFSVWLVQCYMFCRSIGPLNWTKSMLWKEDDPKHASRKTIHLGMFLIGRGSLAKGGDFPGDHLSTFLYIAQLDLFFKITCKPSFVYHVILPISSYSWNDVAD